jgi:hypothetical protein
MGKIGVCILTMDVAQWITNVVIYSRTRVTFAHIVLIMGCSIDISLQRLEWGTINILFIVGMGSFVTLERDRRVLRCLSHIPINIQGIYTHIELAYLHSTPYLPQ